MKSYNTILNENLDWAKETFAKIDKKMSAMTLRSRDKIPDGVDANGMHVDRMQTNPNWWCNGFWGGLNFMLYAYTKNEEYRLARNSDNLQTFIQDYLKEERHHYLASVTKLDLVSPLKILIPIP